MLVSWKKSYISLEVELLSSMLSYPISRSITCRYFPFQSRWQRKLNNSKETFYGTAVVLKKIIFLIGWACASQSPLGILGLETSSQRTKHLLGNGFGISHKRMKVSGTPLFFSSMVQIIMAIAQTL